MPFGMGSSLRSRGNISPAQLLSLWILMLLSRATRVVMLCGLEGGGSALPLLKNPSGQLAGSHNRQRE